MRLVIPVFSILFGGTLPGEPHGPSNLIAVVFEEVELVGKEVILMSVRGDLVIKPRSGQLWQLTRGAEGGGGDSLQALLVVQDHSRDRTLECPMLILVPRTRDDELIAKQASFDLFLQRRTLDAASRKRVYASS